MSAPGSVAGQLSARQQAEQLHSYMQDLFTWEKEIKAKEKAIKAAPKAERVLPPVRGSSASSPIAVPQPAAAAPAPAAAAAGVKAKSSAAAHTYDNYRSKWEAFDVDAALASVDSAPGQAAASGAAAPPKNAAAASPAAPPQTAEGWKDAGNAAFRAGEYQRAVECYGASLAAGPSCLGFANRAMARLKLGQAAEAEADCSRALELDPSYAKAYLRRGTARRELAAWAAAAADFEAALRLDPGSKDAARDRRDCLAQAMAQEGLQALQRWERVALTPGAQEAPELMTATHTERRVPAQAAAAAKKAAPVPAVVTPARASGDDDAPPPLVAAVEAAPAEPMQVDSAAALVVAQPASPEPQREPPAQAATVSTPGPAAATAGAAKRLGASAHRPPRTGVEFERAWRGFKGDEAQQAGLLLALAPAQLPALLRQALTPPLLAGAVRALLGPGAAAAPGEAAALLEALPGVPRFGMNLLSLSVAERGALSAEWDAAVAAAAGRDPAAAARLAAARFSNL